MIKTEYTTDHKTRILIVEDERLYAEDLSIRMEQNDFSVVGIAGTGKEALRLTEEAKPDIILMDIQLRGKMNGIEAARHIHQNYAVPVIFATAYGDDEHISQALHDADAYGFLHKPIDDQTAHTMIKIALTRFATDQMMLRINELLSVKDSIYSGLEATGSIEDISALLHDCFSETNIFNKFWTVIWSEDKDIAASQCTQLSAKVFKQYLQAIDRKSLEDQKIMIPDELMNTLTEGDNYLVVLRDEDQVVGLFGFSWDMGVPNFRRELAVIKDVAQLISQRIKNAKLEDRQLNDKKIIAESEAHIKAIVEQSTTGIYIIDHNSRFIYANDRLCQIFDRPREELLGTNFYEYLGPSRSNVVKNYQDRQAGKDAPNDYSLDIIRPGGEMRDILVSANAFTDSEGHVKNVGHALDVTDQNLATLQIKKLSQAVEQSPVMTIITDISGKMEYVNSEFMNKMGYSHEELIGSNPRIFKSDWHDKEFYNELWSTILGGSVWSGEMVNKKQNGEESWGKISISPIRDAYGTITHFVGLIEDINRQKQEEARAQKDQKLRDVLYAITSAAIKANDVSSLYEKIYQFISEIISTSNFYLALLNKADNTLYFPYETDSFDSEMPESIPCDPETSLTARTIIEQRTLHVQQAEIQELIESNQVIIAGELPSVWLGIPLIVKDEVIGAFVLQEYDGLTYYDDEDVKLLDLAAGQVAITIDRARKAKALKQLAEELANANGMKELLLDVITHDLRNPAGVIGSISELLSAQDSTNEMFEVLQGSAESLMTVIENATVLSKLSIGEEITRSKLDLVPMLNDMQTEFASQLATATMTIKSDLPESCIVEANPIISEIPKNYIGNAIKYSKPGGCIEIVLKEEAGKVTLQVNDDGKPIPAEMREAIFERNVQLSEGEKQGSGLGLAIVKRIALAHEASVGIEDSPSGGNSFFLRF